MGSPGAASLDNCWAANAARVANRIDAQRELRMPILIYWFVNAAGSVSDGSIPRQSTKTKHSDSVRGHLAAEEQVSGVRARPQGGCGVSDLPLSSEEMS